MDLIRRLSRSPASRTAAASYLAFASTALWGLVTIPVAVAFLDPLELGLWTVVNAFLHYLVWMDLGVGAATGRLIADAVAARDQTEINRWWTATRAVLITQGAIIIVLGLAISPLIIRFLSVPNELLADTRWLLIGGFLITGLSLPMRGTPGLLTAQNRFFWVPLIQVFSPWINFFVFFHLLREGQGLKSYIWAMAVGQAVTWIAYSCLIRTGPDRPRADFSGLQRTRFGKLFKLSGNMSVSGLSDSILNSLPAILIARLSGLANVPIYNFSWKGPQLASGLVQRTYQSFYPSMQRLYVTGQHEAFRQKHTTIGMLTLGIAMCAAALLLSLNTVVVQALAGDSFFAGPATNTGFALAMITIPMCGLFRILLPISGDLGKTALISLAQLAFFVGLSLLLWPAFSLAGVAFAFALTPLLKGVYGYVRGTKGCGFPPHGISRNVALASLAAMALVVTCGLLGSQLSWQSNFTLTIPGRTLNFPPLHTFSISALPALIGLPLIVYSTRGLLRR